MAVARSVGVGDRIPDVEAPLVTPGGEVIDWQLSGAITETPALLCFYTADFETNWQEGWSMLHELQWFSNDDIDVIGISKSNTWVHRWFLDRLGLQFPLCSDRDLSIAERFGLCENAFGAIDRPRKACFLVAPDRTVRDCWIGDRLSTPGGAGCAVPIGDIFESVRDQFGVPETETFGFRPIG